ncbi:MAG: hypothetical protein KF802_10065 [Bdellovibrionaceae bacterium]|nr:hypothetical protein [Pseudobdellovibrionaceae bacterium]MBX3033756.1 hypothetical protein [Pseudobdellovibrionaceae bacterium]
MSKFFIGAGIILFSLQSAAGASNTTLKCSSADKKIRVDGQVPGDLAEFDLKVFNGGRESRFFSFVNQTTLQTEENASVKIVEDLDVGVYTLAANTRNSPLSLSLELYAIPSTLKKTKIPNGARSSFEAKMVFFSNEFAAGPLKKRLNCTTFRQF